MSGTFSLNKSLGHCARLLKKHDYEGYVCSQFLPWSLRPLRWTLGAFNVETALIKTTSQNPELCAARIQFWDNAIFGDSGVESPTVSALRYFMENSPTLRFRLKTFLKARARDLAQPTYYHVSDIEIYSERTYSNLNYVLLDALGKASVESDHAASHLGKAQGLISFIRGAVPLAFRGAEPGLPMSLLGQNNLSQEQVLHDKEVWTTRAMQNVIHMLAEAAWIHLDQASKIIDECRHSSELHQVLLPNIPLRRYLCLLQEHDFDLSQQEVFRYDRWLPLVSAWHVMRQRIQSWS